MPVLISLPIKKFHSKPTLSAKKIRVDNRNAKNCVVSFHA